MNQQLTRIFLALSLLGAWGIATRLSAAESAAQQAASAPAIEQPAEKQVTEKQVAEPAAVSPGTEQNTAGAKAATTDEPAPEKKPEPVTGGFGITLGECFDPSMVAKVIGQEEKSYTGREKAKFKGNRYQVEPKAASKVFEKYSIDTTDQGVIYAIQGEYLQAGKEKACKKVTKGLAAKLEERYGKPRGKGMHGEWYSFRDMSRDAYRGVRLYANRCASGRYSIVYSDDQVKKAALASEPETQTTQAEPEAQAKQAEPKPQATQE